jgi:hypothetical protein
LAAASAIAIVIRIFLKLYLMHQHVNNVLRLLPLKGTKFIFHSMPAHFFSISLYLCHGHGEPVRYILYARFVLAILSHRSIKAFEPRIFPMSISIPFPAQSFFCPTINTYFYLFLFGFKDNLFVSKAFPFVFGYPSQHSLFLVPLAIYLR